LFVKVCWGRVEPRLSLEGLDDIFADWLLESALETLNPILFV
jgi:hypothetical protein